MMPPVRDWIDDLVDDIEDDLFLEEDDEDYMLADELYDVLGRAASDYEWYGDDGQFDDWWDGGNDPTVIRVDDWPMSPYQARVEGKLLS